MKRLIAFVLTVSLAFVPRVASAQAVVSDPVLEQYATQNWTRDANNAVNMAKTAISAAQQVSNQIKSLQSQLAEMQQLPQTVWRNAQSQIAELAQITKAGYAVSAYDQMGSSQLQKLFDPTQYQQVLPADFDQQWSAKQQSVLGNAANAVGMRVSQMNQEEGQISFIRSLAQSNTVSQKQALQLGLMIADQQLEEMRAMERMMAQHYDTQYAFMDSEASTHSGIRTALADQAAQSFWQMRFTGHYVPSGQLPMSNAVMPVVNQ